MTHRNGSYIGGPVAPSTKLKAEDLPLVLEELCKHFSSDTIIAELKRRNPKSRGRHAVYTRWLDMVSVIDADDFLAGRPFKSANSLARQGARISRGGGGDETSRIRALKGYLSLQEAQSPQRALKRSRRYQLLLCELFRSHWLKMDACQRARTVVLLRDFVTGRPDAKAILELAEGLSADGLAGLMRSANASEIAEKVGRLRVG